MDLFEKCGEPSSLLNMLGGNQGNIRELCLLAMMGTLCAYC